ncbi:hypothetical protein [Actinacidiphila yeochonensis]|uniref:hypothetical protein n=1 Tax=Actinacidiphila yeochonensis TaxID=89050 RepID=UPI00056048A2|nr:hypothetical protein [Actinacidiphila yeochonensis]
MTRTPRTAGTATAALVAAVALLVLTSGCAAVHQGDVQPTDVEKKGHVFVQQTLAAIRPVTGTAKTTVYDQGWTQCATETPGQHRFEYTFFVDVAVPKSKLGSVVTAARADFAHRGYTNEYVPEPATGAVAAPPKSEWRINVGAGEGATVLLGVDSDCVFTRHDPKTVK